MRGADDHSVSVLTLLKPEDFVLANHRLRPIRAWVVAAWPIDRLGRSLL